MKVSGQNIPSADLLEYKGSLQQATGCIGRGKNLYGIVIYNQTKYGTSFYVRMRYPFGVPHMQGGERNT